MTWLWLKGCDLTLAQEGGCDLALGDAELAVVRYSGVCAHGFVREEREREREQTRVEERREKGERARRRELKERNIKKERGVAGSMKRKKMDRKTDREGHAF